MRFLAGPRNGKGVGGGLEGEHGLSLGHCVGHGGHAFFEGGAVSDFDGILFEIAGADGEADGDAEEVGVVELDAGGLVAVVVKDFQAGGFKGFVELVCGLGDAGSVQRKGA